MRYDDNSFPDCEKEIKEVDRSRKKSEEIRLISYTTWDSENGNRISMGTFSAYLCPKETKDRWREDLSLCRLVLCIPAICRIVPEV